MEQLRLKALELGAYKAAVISVADIPTDVSFRAMCASNACGQYGKNYQCPPDVGDIDELIAKLGTFRQALVYQTVSQLEDSYDFEGMQEAGTRHNRLVQALQQWTDTLYPHQRVLHMGAGGCRLCPTCGKVTQEPCRFPDRAIGSLEAHGIHVSKLAEVAGMRYINGQDTVTYFGAVLL